MPDLNPIENLLDYLEQRVKRRRSPPANLAKLRDLLLEEWMKIDVTYIRTLVASMPDRISVVLRSHGGVTRYHVTFSQEGLIFCRQHAALIGGANSQSCPVCHKICMNAEALMDHMRTAHKDPNASGTPSKKKRGRSRFRPDSIVPSSVTGTGINLSLPTSNSSPCPSPASCCSPVNNPNASTSSNSLTIPNPCSTYSNSLTSSGAASLMSSMGMGMGPFVVPSMMGGPGHLGPHHSHAPQNHYAHHPLVARTQPSFLNL